jgi:hypothetical protein
MQRFLIVNIDRREYLDPSRFGDGQGLMEFGPGASGAMLALALLLATGCAGGPLEPKSKDPIVGSWAESRIAITGDRDQTIFTGALRTELRLLPVGPSLYEVASTFYVDISERLLRVIAEEPYEARALREKGVTP